MTKLKAFGLLILIIGASGLIYYISLNTGIINPGDSLCSAKAAFDVANAYATAGEPDARLYDIRLSGANYKDGKGDEWEMRFVAPDGTNIKLEVKAEYGGFLGEYKWKTFLCYPLEGPASEKAPSELWNEARDEIKLRYEDCMESWVDSMEVFGDALERATEDVSDSWLYYMRAEKYWSGDLPEGGHPWVWKICFRTNAYGYEYIYDAANGRYLHRVWLIA